MLKVNVGLSRKLSRDYNSTGFSLNLDGELCAGMDDLLRPQARLRLWTRLDRLRPKHRGHFESETGCGSGLTQV